MHAIDGYFNPFGHLNIIWITRDEIQINIYHCCRIEFLSTYVYSRGNHLFKLFSKPQFLIVSKLDY